MAQGWRGTAAVFVWLTVVGNLVVADVQIRDGRVSDQSGHEHSHEVVVNQIALGEPGIVHQTQEVPARAE